MKKHHKPRTRILSLALAAMMLLCLLPMSVFAKPAAEVTTRKKTLDLTAIDENNTQGATYDDVEHTYTNNAEKWMYDEDENLLLLFGVNFVMDPGETYGIILPPDANLAKIEVQKGSENTIVAGQPGGRGIYIQGATEASCELRIARTFEGDGPAKLSITADTAVLDGANDANDFKLNTVLDGAQFVGNSPTGVVFRTNQLEVLRGSMEVSGGNKIFDLIGDNASITIGDDFKIQGSALPNDTSGEFKISAVNRDKTAIQLGLDAAGDVAKTAKVAQRDRISLLFKNGKLLMGDLSERDEMVEVDPDKLGGWSIDGKTLTLTNFSFQTDAEVALEMEDGSTLAFSGTNVINNGDFNLPNTDGRKRNAVLEGNELTLSGADDNAILNLNSGDIRIGHFISDEAGGDSSAIFANVLKITKGIVKANAGKVSVGTASGPNLAVSTGIVAANYSQTGGDVRATGNQTSIGTSDAGISTGIILGSTIHDTPFSITGGTLLANGQQMALYSIDEVILNNLSVIGNADSTAPDDKPLKQAHFNESAFGTIYTLIAASNTSSSPAIADAAKYALFTTKDSSGVSVSGQVTNSTGAPIAGSAVRLMQNAQVKYETITNSNGNYFFPNVEKGFYNLVSISDGESSINQGIEVAQKSIIQNMQHLLPGSSVKANGALYPVVFGLNDLLNSNNIDAILTAEQKALLSGGGYLTLAFSGNYITDPKGDADLIQAIAPGKAFDEFINLKLILTAFENDGSMPKENTLTSLPQTITVVFDLPSSLIGKEGLALYRVHNGVAEAMQTTPNADGEYYEISANGKYIRLVLKKFSTYGIGYNSTNGDGGGGGNGGNGYYTGTGNGTWNPGTGNLPQPGDRLPSFTDVTKTDWYYDAVMTAVAKGWFTGTSQTTFGPNETTTRGMIATILHRMAGSPIVTAPNFGDVATDTWYTSGIAWAQNNGIVTGYGNNKYGPNDNITREQLASILYRYAQLKGFDTSKTASLENFADAGRVSTYAKDAMGWALGTGLISGRDGQSLAPGAYATRAEVATVLVRLLQLYGM